ncbi:hypothetical protein SAMN04488101_11972 [Pedobacter nyackensis]|uniref:Uncharacterized protein n=1 Tax=Pedobacter nyackensis TaxID=475255 RepID=A0A1W2F459_9SPHI|nr:hypothetical protein SAMN04488101_11972 [Pedobacter nyackensis]
MELQILSPTEDHAIYSREFILQLDQKFKPLKIFTFSKNSYPQDDQGRLRFQNLSHLPKECLKRQ